MENRKAILGLKPYASDAYMDIDYDRLALFGLSLLLEQGFPTTLENLSVALFRLFPGRFSMSGYEFPDSSKVQQSFLHMRPKYRNWVEGSPTQGFAVTATGRDVLEQTKRLLGRVATRELSADGKRTTPPRPNHVAMGELALLRQSELYQAYGSKVPVEDESRLAYEMLGVLAYTPKYVVNRRMRTLRDMAQRARDDDVEAFLVWVGTTFKRVFDDSGEGGSR